MYKSFRGWKRDIGVSASLVQQVDLAKTAGFEGVEVNIWEAAKLAENKGIEYLRRIFADNAILPAGWPLTVNWRGNESTYHKNLTELEHFAEVGQRLGSFRVVSGIAPFSDERPFKENFDWHIERLRPIAEILKKHSCRLGLEYIGSQLTRSGHKHEFIHNIEGTLELCSAIGTGNVGLLLDSWHWYTARETLKDIQELTGEQVVYVHINDAPKDVHFDQLGEGPRCIPGETGLIDLVGLLECLRDIDYDGPVVPEPDHRFCDQLKKISAPEAARVLSEAMDNLWAKSDLGK